MVVINIRTTTTFVSEGASGLKERIATFLCYKRLMNLNCYWVLFFSKGAVLFKTGVLIPSITYMLVEDFLENETFLEKECQLFYLLLVSNIKKAKVPHIYAWEVRFLWIAQNARVSS